MMEEILFPGPLSVRAAFNWINRWVRNWPSGATLTAEQEAQMADHFVRGLDPYESAAAIAEGRTL
jgi:hypothetical protein